MKEYGYDEANVINVDLNEEFGWQSERLELVGTKAGGGKTQYSVVKAAEALKDGKSVLFFSTESKGKEIYRRVLNEVAPTVLDKQAAEFALTAEERTMIKDARRFVNETNFIVDDKSTISEGYIDEKVKSMAKESYGVDLVIVDTINLVKIDNDLGNHLRANEVLKGFERLANKVDCDFLVTTQLIA